MLLCFKGIFKPPFVVHYLGLIKKLLKVSIHWIRYTSLELQHTLGFHLINFKINVETNEKTENPQTIFVHGKLGFWLFHQLTK